jgi:hypothetical protein
MKFRKKPVVVEAVQFLPNDESTSKIMALADIGTRKVEVFVSPEGMYSMYIHTLEGKMEAKVGDWIIRGVSGELYPCKPDIFLQTYEVVV